MNTLLSIGFLLTIVVSCNPLDQSVPVESCQETTSLNANYPKAQAVQQLLDRYIRTGIPGIAVAVYSPEEGYWAGASGYANLESKTPMQVCHLHYGQSLTKTYTAVAILQLVESGQLDLNLPISRYLPETITGLLPDVHAVTVRMLLNHTSGLADYTANADYVASVLQHPLRTYSSRELLAYLDKTPLQFTPGHHAAYSNTNYLLLALIADQIQGDHARLIQDRVLRPLNLQRTFYHDQADYLNRPNLVDSYFDRFGNGKLENITQMQRANVGSMHGDDGIIAPPIEYINFLRGVFEGRLVSTQSLLEMTTWIKDQRGKPTYGLGLERTEFAGQVAYGHGGAGLGAGCGLYYFPDKGIYVYISINVGVVTDGPYTQQASHLSNELVDILLK
jgi:D-alanyl-D-alanine carboxypeptidase